MTGIWVESLGVVMIPMIGCWCVSVLRRDVSVVDVYWGPGFGVAASWFLYRTDTPSALSWVAWFAVVLWAVRLGAHLGIRWWKKGEEDVRYAAMRAEHGSIFVIRSLITVFTLQGVLIWLLSPLFLAPIASSREMGVLAWVGFAVFAFGWVWEAVADWQLTAFRADMANRGRVLESGLWRYSRHPNYFGDAVTWWGFFLLAASAGAWWTIYAPVIMTALLMRVTGVPILEKHLSDTRPGYAEYVRRTSSFFPRPPRPAR